MVRHGPNGNRSLDESTGEYLFRLVLLSLVTVVNRSSFVPLALTFTGLTQWLITAMRAEFQSFWLSGANIGGLNV